MTQRQMDTGPPSGGTPQSDIVNSDNTDSNDQTGPGGAPAATLPNVVPEAMRSTQPNDSTAAPNPSPMTKRAMFSNMSNKVMDNWAALEASRTSETDSADSVVLAQNRLDEVMGFHRTDAIRVDARRDALAESVKSMANFMDDWYTAIMHGHEVVIPAEGSGAEETPG